MKALMTFTTFILLGIMTIALVRYRPLSQSKLPLTSSCENVLIELNKVIQPSILKAPDLMGEEQIDNFSHYYLFIERKTASNATLDFLYLAHSPPPLA